MRLDTSAESNNKKNVKRSPFRNIFYLNNFFILYNNRKWVLQEKRNHFEKDIHRGSNRRAVIAITIHYLAVSRKRAFERGDCR